MALCTGLRGGDAPAVAGLNTPGVLWPDFLILGAHVAETVPGPVRPFSVRTRPLPRVFPPIPPPGRAGPHTSPAAG